MLFAVSKQLKNLIQAKYLYNSNTKTLFVKFYT